MKKILISIVLITLLAACASEKPKEVVPEPVILPKVTPVVVVPTPEPKPIPAPVAKVEVDPLNDPSSILGKRSVYYPFDVAAVQDADKPVLQAHGQYLSTHANRKVRLEGNCDERGSTEYNLGLGQRRADGVKEILKLSGANDSQLESVSLGEEKQVAAGHDEASWSQNRRTDLIYAK